VNIAGHEIGKEPFIIAEAGLNHGGDINAAIEMIGTAAACGVTAVKFQTFKAADVCDEEQDYSYKSQGKKVTEKRIEIFRRCELPVSAWPHLKAECDRQGVIFLSTPETPADLDILLEVGIPAIKIGSDNLTNLPMLRYCARDDVGLPMIISTGMSTADEIETARKTIGDVPRIWMVCTSQYPTPTEDANLLRIKTMFKSPCLMGFSDHTRGYMPAALAVALGACVFEKHFTLSHDMPGPDHWWSAEPKELENWVDMIHKAHVMLGDGIVKPSKQELVNKEQYQRKVAA